MANLQARFSAFAAAALLGACGAEDSSAPSKSTPSSPPEASAPAAADQDADSAPGPNLLLVTVDSARADRIGAFGYEAARTPNLDQLAEKGARFTRAYAQVPWSLPAHACLLTGAYPLEHGLHDNGRGMLSVETPTLAELYRQRSHRTGAFVASIALNRRHGLANGFDVYDDDMGQPIGTRGQFVERKAEAVVDDALAWLDEGEGPFFAWIHFADPSLRHEPPSAFEMEDPYDGELAYVDAQIGRLTEWLAADPARENTLFVAVAAHGESLGEKGETAHGSLIYEGTQHIPLIVSWPGRLEGGRVIDDLVSQVDLLPTVMELSGWSTPKVVSGRSLAPLLSGQELPPRPVYLENDYCALSFDWSTLRGVVEEQWKYIQAPTPELYDLAADPGETKNLAAENPEVAAALATKLAELRAGMTPRPADLLRDPADPTRLLYQLGLTLAAGRGVVGEPGVGQNPIEEIELLELYHAALRYGYLVQIDRMGELVQKIVEDYPELAAAHLLQGEIQTLRGQFEDARAQHQMAVDLDPENPQGHYFLARAYQSLGYPGEAMAHYQVVVELRPDNVMARQPLARLLVAQQDIPAAIEQYREITKAKPELVRHWINYANLLRNQGHWKEVVEALKNATDLEPDNWNHLNYYAWTLATAPDDEARDGPLAVEVAERMFQQVGQEIVILDTLGAAYAEVGRWGKARDSADRALLLAKQRGTPKQVQEITARRALYEMEKPFRDGQ